MDQETYELVKSYLRGELTEEARTTFENRMEQDPVFSDEVSAYGKMLYAIDAYGDQLLDQQLKEQGKALFAKKTSEASAEPEARSGRIVGFQRWYAVALAACLVILVAIFLPRLSRPATAEELYSLYFSDPKAYGVRDGGPQEQNWSSAMSSYEEARYPEAISTFQEMLESNTTDRRSEAWLYIGLSHLKQDEHEAALQAFEQVSDTSKQIDLADWYIALSYLAKGEVETARSQVETIVNSIHRHEKKEEAIELLSKIERLL
ncbi:MAG: tetratricopeptide repeat protein [Bacteroidota bacterium]